MAITTAEYQGFEKAYDYFNDVLFAGKLPQCLITLQRRKHTRGYYSPHRFKNRINQGFTDEIALNPAEFVGRTDEEILSTLCHKMTHQYQRIYGTPGRGKYHNREWADMMIDLGLIPSHTGKPGGRQTGDIMSHYIREGGRFETACEKLLRTGFKLNWQSVEKRVPSRTTPSKVQVDEDSNPKNKKKFTCHRCGLNAWAKPSAVLVCGICYQDAHIICVMNAHSGEDFSDWRDKELASLSLGVMTEVGQISA